MATCPRRISYSYMMNFTLFETAIGCCGTVWSERGIAGVQLPERSEAATRNRLMRRFPRGARGCAHGGGAARHRRHCCPSRRRAQRFKSCDDRYRCGAGVPSTRLRGRAPHPCRGDALLRRSRGTSGRPRSGPRRRGSIVGKSLPHHCALSSDTSGRWEAWRLFRPGGRGNQASAADDRGRTTRRSHAVRSIAIGRGETATLTAP